MTKFSRRLNYNRRQRNCWGRHLEVAPEKPTERTAVILPTVATAAIQPQRLVLALVLPV